MELNFRSDNESPADPEILAAVVEANHGSAWSYAEDALSNRLDGVFSDLFDTETTVLPVSSGTAANSIALACVTPPWGSVYCHEEAHILQDECGAPEFFGDGLRLVPVSGPDGKLSAEALQKAVARDLGHGVHSYIPSTLSVTQSTEAGTVYSRGEIGALCQTAATLGMTAHMDGARFANAIARLGCSPAEISWQAGIRLLSFGASKNGCLAAEALLVFNDPGLRERAERLRKRSGHLISKMRFISAQLLAYLQNDRWLHLARKANLQATRFAECVRRHPEAELAYSPDANEIFVRWKASAFNALDEAGIQFLTWPGHDDLARFVFSHSTSAEETTRLCEEMNRLTPAA